MNADDFQELYKLLRGSKSAMPVLDAKALYSDRKMVASLEKLIYARESFLESRSRLLKQDVEQQVDKKAKDADRQIKKLKRKQDKLLDIVKAFEELIAQLEKLAERERQRIEKAEALAESEQQLEQQTQRRESLAEVVARRSDLTTEFCQAFAAADSDRQLEMVSDQFGFREVKDSVDLFGEALYLIRAGAQSYLVCTPASDTMDQVVAVTSAVGERPIKPFSRDDFLNLGRRRKMVLLTRRDVARDPAAEPNQGVQESDVSETGRPSGEAPNAESPTAETPTAESPTNETPQAEPSEPDVPAVLDMGAFSQLLTSAQRCGLVPGADQIGHVRDREFRRGDYDRAFQAIETLYSRFTTSASQRTQRLAREDADIASGRVKMSPKDLQAKRARDRSQTQEVDRAMRRFQVVLEGLRVLMNTQPTT